MLNLKHLAGEISLKRTLCAGLLDSRMQSFENSASFDLPEGFTLERDVKLERHILH